MGKIITEYTAPAGTGRYDEDAQELFDVFNDGNPKAATVIEIDISGAKAGERKLRGSDETVKFTADEDAERIVSNEKAAFQTAAREIGYTAKAVETTIQDGIAEVIFQVAPKRKTAPRDGSTSADESATVAPEAAK